MDDVLTRPLGQLQAVLGLGSNLGDREAHLQNAISALNEVPSIRLKGIAKLYETPPFGGPAQGDYLNTAVLIETALSPQDILRVALSVEQKLGRVRFDGSRWGPRTIDIDLLWIDGVSINEEALRVPHPFLHERAFALRPLLDLVAVARDPRTGAAYGGLAAAVAPITIVPWNTA